MSTYVSFSPRSADLCKARGTHQLTAAHLQLQEHLKATQHPLTTPQKPHSGPCYTTLSSGQSPVGFSEQPHANPDQLQNTHQPFCYLLRKDEAWLGFLHQLKGYFLRAEKQDRDIEGQQFSVKNTAGPRDTGTDLKKLQEQQVQEMNMT